MTWRWLVPVLLAAWSGPVSAAEIPASDAEGQALAAELRSAPPPENLEVEGLIRIRREDGRRTNQPFRYRVVAGNDSWQHIYEATPSLSHPGETLVVAHRPDAPPTYTLTRRTGPSAKDLETVTLAGDQAMIPFANSDFWLADLGLEFLHWPRQRIDRNTRLTMRKGRSCRVLESINDRPGASGYTRVRSWVDIKTGGIIIAEAYAGERRMSREFEIGGFTKVDDHWALKNMEIRNLQTDSRTILEFNYEGAE
jgi:hypothetical protein